MRLAQPREASTCAKRPFAWWTVRAGSGHVTPATAALLQYSDSPSPDRRRSPMATALQGSAGRPLPARRRRWGRRGRRTVTLSFAAGTSVCTPGGSPICQPWPRELLFRSAQNASFPCLPLYRISPYFLQHQTRLTSPSKCALRARRCDLRNRSQRFSTLPGIPPASQLLDHLAYTPGKRKRGPFRSGNAAQ